MGHTVAMVHNLSIAEATPDRFIMQLSVGRDELSEMGVSLPRGFHQECFLDQPYREMQLNVENSVFRRQICV